MVLLGEVEDEKAERLVKVCPQNVFDIEDMGNGKSQSLPHLPSKYSYGFDFIVTCGKTGR